MAICDSTVLPEPEVPLDKWTIWEVGHVVPLKSKCTWSCHEPVGSGCRSLRFTWTEIALQCYPEIGLMESCDCSHAKGKRFWLPPFTKAVILIAQTRTGKSVGSCDKCLPTHILRREDGASEHLEDNQRLSLFLENTINKGPCWNLKGFGFPWKTTALWVFPSLFHPWN